MADFDHNLSLADALTEPPPQIEEEVKRDFIATLEAEKFDDVVGETVGKTDYVPLLDDDDPKAGNQETKTKPHADSVPVERKCLDAACAVLNEWKSLGANSTKPVPLENWEGHCIFLEDTSTSCLPKLYSYPPGKQSAMKPDGMKEGGRDGSGLLALGIGAAAASIALSLAEWEGDMASELGCLALVKP